ncbi:MAG: radical SAM protein [Candidatus Omnitrophota bacterium]
MNSSFAEKRKIKSIKRILPFFRSALKDCGLCFRKCGVNRLKGKKGFCSAGSKAVIYCYGPHFGEEPPLSGKNGSGAIFFSGCSMKCVYCQNHRFSQNLCSGKECSSRELAAIMIELQQQGCHNINLVNPTHYMSTIIEALECAYEEGLRVPLVYNTGGYDSFDMIRMLEGVIDIYLPDMRYSDDFLAGKYSDAEGYTENNKTLVKEMYRQTGLLACTKNIARKGLIIRLLILPGAVSGTEETLEFLAGELGQGVSISVMSQYYPAYKAKDYIELSQGITQKEYTSVMNQMEKLKLRMGWVQPFSADFDERFAGENLNSH